MVVSEPARRVRIKHPLNLVLCCSVGLDWCSHFKITLHIPPLGLHKSWATLVGPQPRLDRNFKQRYILISRVIGPHSSSLSFPWHP